MNYVNKKYNNFLSFFKLYKPNMTFKCSGTVFANLARYRRTKDLVPLFGLNVHLFEKSLLKILTQLQSKVSFFGFRRKFRKKTLNPIIVKIFFFKFPINSGRESVKFLCIDAHKFRRSIENIS